MPRPPRPRRDLSTQEGNPTNALETAFSELMATRDPDEMASMALSVVKPLVGHGMSEQNFAKFQHDLARATERGLVNVQQYLSNYILKGSGLGVSLDHVEALASAITEDIDEFRDLTNRQKALMTLVESCTRFKVVIR